MWVCWRVLLQSAMIARYRLVYSNKDKRILVDNFLQFQLKFYGYFGKVICNRYWAFYWAKLLFYIVCIWGALISLNDKMIIFVTLTCFICTQKMCMVMSLKMKNHQLQWIVKKIAKWTFFGALFLSALSWRFKLTE